MKVTIFIFLFFVLSFWGSSQQIPQYSQWWAHQFAMNPAHAGIKKCIDIHSVYRTQWVGLNGAPRSGFVTASIPINTKRKKYLSARYGIGGRFETDKIGQFNTNRFNLAYAAHFNFNEYNRLSLGIYAGMVQFGYDHSSSVVINPDPVVMQEMNILRPDAHFGAWWNGKHYYIGLMLNQLIVSKWEVGYESNFSFHAALNGGYRFILGDNIGLVPAAMIRIPFAGPISADINVNVDYKNIFNIGIGYRMQDAVILTAGFKIKQQFSLIYSFDFTVSTLNRVSNNTHEIGISFITCKPQNTSTSKCPLFE